MIAGIMLLSFVASAIGTITSFGTSTIMVPVLGLFYPLRITLLFTGIIHWFGNLWKMWFFRSGVQIKLILLFGIPGVMASYFGARLVPGMDERLLSRLLGVFMMAYVIFLALNRDWKINPSKSTAIFGGVLSGFSSGIFGVGGAIRAAFLTSFKLNKEVFIFTAGSIGFFIDSGRLISYTLDGTSLNSDLLIALLVSVPVSFLGSYAGKKITEKIPQESFRNVISLALFLMAVKYILIP